MQHFNRQIPSCAMTIVIVDDADARGGSARS